MPQRSPRARKIPPVQAKAAEVQEIIETYFIDDYDEDTLADGAASGMVDATGDEWSYYLSADEVAAYEESMGERLRRRRNHDHRGCRGRRDARRRGRGRQARRRKLESAWAICCWQVEGEDVLPLGIDGTRNLVRGEEGTHVNMHFSRNGTEYDVSGRAAEHRDAGRDRGTAGREHRLYQD